LGLTIVIANESQLKNWIVISTTLAIGLIIAIILVARKKKRSEVSDNSFNAKAL